MTQKMTIALTGPSAFTSECISMIEDENGLNANFVLLYQNKPENVEQWLSKCDGVVLSGGIDVHPTCYGGNVENNKGLSKFDLARDIKELFVIDYAIKNRMPLLGICRGHQLMGVYKGLRNDFVQDLSFGDVCHQPQRANITLTKNEPTHGIYIHATDVLGVKVAKERSLLAKYLNQQEQEALGWVNSYHHQAIECRNKKYEYGKLHNIQILATATTGLKDCPHIIEAMQGIGEESNWITVQWHPEADYDENSWSGRVVEIFRNKLKENQKKQ